ncbi:MAG: hypothetical protein ACM3X6_04715 [Patescibacteria group bacterium]
MAGRTPLIFRLRLEKWLVLCGLAYLVVGILSGLVEGWAQILQSSRRVPGPEPVGYLILSAGASLWTDVMKAVLYGALGVILLLVKRLLPKAGDSAATPQLVWGGVIGLVIGLWNLVFFFTHPDWIWMSTVPAVSLSPPRTLMNALAIMMVLKAALRAAAIGLALFGLAQVVAGLAGAADPARGDG